MSIKSLGLRVDVIAPDSENTLLTEEQMKVLKKSYKNIVTLLDSDEAGINAMQKYKEKYDIPFVYLPLEKDISDIVKFHGKDRAIVELVPKLNRILDATLVK
jgi:DNA primase